MKDLLEELLETIAQEEKSSVELSTIQNGSSPTEAFSQGFANESTLMQIAGLSDTDITWRLHLAMKLDISRTPLLFEAGIAVPEQPIHQAFRVDGPPTTEPLAEAADSHQAATEHDVDDIDSFFSVDDDSPLERQGQHVDNGVVESDLVERDLVEHDFITDDVTTVIDLDEDSEDTTAIEADEFTDNFDIGPLYLESSNPDAFYLEDPTIDVEAADVGTAEVEAFDIEGVTETVDVTLAEAEPDPPQEGLLGRLFQRFFKSDEPSRSPDLAEQATADEVNDFFDDFADFEEEPGEAVRSDPKGELTSEAPAYREEPFFETTEEIGNQPATDAEADIEQALSDLLDEAVADRLFEIVPADDEETAAQTNNGANHQASHWANDQASPLESLEADVWLNLEEDADGALHLAAAVGDVSGLWWALESNASVNTLGPEQRTALSVAVEAGHIPVVELLLEMCADTNRADVVNGSPVRYPLTIAASDTPEPIRAELLEMLIARGANVNQADALGQTALMGAAEQGNIDSMRLLIEANADIEAQDLLGQTAMMRAAENQQAEAIALLQASLLERARAIALLKAVTEGDLAAVEQWLAAGVSPNARVARMSALTQAAALGEGAIAQRLIDAGAEVDYRLNPTDPTPLFHAIYRGQLETVELLISAGASVHPTPDNPIEAIAYAEVGRSRAENPAAFEPIVALMGSLVKRPG